MLSRTAEAPSKVGGTFVCKGRGALAVAELVRVRQQQLRLIVFGIAIVLIGVAAVAEPPGLVAGVGYAVVVLAIIFTVVRERRH